MRSSRALNDISRDEKNAISVGKEPSINKTLSNCSVCSHFVLLFLLWPSHIELKRTSAHIVLQELVNT